MLVAPDVRSRGLTFIWGSSRAAPNQKPLLFRLRYGSAMLAASAIVFLDANTALQFQIKV
ncbi:hypothetical protein QUB68_18810 [Microcoleus sp. A006_D1]|uniref:hypothetical protein n=1 Tax=Microcoleus sp. A006_D1 TaxID=3055267 RepID=UPI002FCE8178